MDTIATRINSVRERIAAAARRAGRSPAQVRLVGVTKTHPPELIAQALAAGLTDFGENRVQEAQAKIAALAAAHPRPTWHLIGHLQTNKAQKAAALFSFVHTLDSLRLAYVLDRYVAQQQADQPMPSIAAEPTLPVLLQVNVSGEASKEGFALAGWEQDRALLDAFLQHVAHILALRSLRISGLMTIAPWGPDPEVARPVFQSTRRLRDLLASHFPSGNWAELSMGMTDDFEVAIEEGATLVRVGRAIFGER